MSEHINTYAACEEHKNGHSEHCEKCETEAVRGLLRGVARAEVVGYSPSQSNTIISLPDELWNNIQPLRTPPIVKVDGNG